MTEATKTDEQRTPGPWSLRESKPVRGQPDDGPSYIELRGPNDEAICTIFPKAGRGGVGYQRALANARLIIAAARAAEITTGTCSHCGKPDTTIVCGVGGCPLGADL